MAGRAAAPRAPEWALPAPPACRPPLAQDTGAVTVEAALAMCALTVFLALALGALIAVAQTMRCADAARELARLAARGEPDRGRAVAARLAPSGARMELLQDGDTVTALVSVRLVGPLPLAVDGRAVAALEGDASP
jgi:hypothetical protein